MDLIIIVIIILFLVGTLSYIRPSKKTRQLSKFRLEALKLGFKFATQNLKSSFKNYDANLEIYLIKNNSDLSQGHFIKEKNTFNCHSPVKLKHDPNLEKFLKKINNLPDSILEIIFFESNIAFLWKENLISDDLNTINEIFSSLDALNNNE